MKQFAFLLFLLSAMQLTAAEPVNIGFSHGLEGWTLVPQKSIETVTLKSGVRLKVVQAQPQGDGALSQRIAGKPEAARMAFSAEASGQGGYLQVKTYRNGRESGRYTSDGTGLGLRTLRCEFPTSEIDSFEICLRVRLDDRYGISDAEFRNLRIEPVRRAPIEPVPLYHSASYYCDFTDPAEPSGVKVGFRRAGETDFRPAWPPVWNAADRQLRGSIIGLEEDTFYEIRLEADGIPPRTGKFRTWKSEVPVAQTIDLSRNHNGKTFVIDLKGKPDGYIRFTAPPDTVLNGGESGPILLIRNAEYVILDGLTLRGGGHNAVEIQNSRNVRVRNCDISGWGIVGTQRFDLDGKFYDQNGKEINYTAGIRIMSSTAVTVERCRIQEPRNRANPWFFSHPSGPQALYVGDLRECVVRWNDFVGCDRHRWNDVIEGWGNFNGDGGFARDADIYGNLLAFGNDDGIELDGGQMNVRCFDNWIEGTYCGISTCGTIRGPSFAFRNLITRLGEERGGASASLKSGRGDGMLFIFSNTLLGGAGVICTNPDLHAVTRNNIIQVPGKVIVEGKPMQGNSFDHDLCFSSGTVNGQSATPESVMSGTHIGSHILYAKTEFINPERGNYELTPGAPGGGSAVEVANFARTGTDPGCNPNGANWPPRPGLGFTVDAIRLDFPAPDAPAQSIAVTAQDDFTFRIVKDKCADWFEVRPESGALRAGETLKLEIRAIPEKFKLAGTRRGGFSIRRPDGLSRPVLVYGECDRDEPIPQETRPLAVFRNDRNRPFSGGKWEFALAEPQSCYLVLRMGTLPPTAAVTVALNGKEWKIRTRTTKLDNYLLSPNDGFVFQVKPLRLELKAGKHTLELAADHPIRFEWAVLTPEPWPFFTRYQR